MTFEIIIIKADTNPPGEPAIKKHKAGRSFASFHMYINLYYIYIFIIYILVVLHIDCLSHTHRHVASSQQGLLSRLQGLMRCMDFKCMLCSDLHVQNCPCQAAAIAKSEATIYILIISARECSLKFDIFNANCNHSPDCEARGSRDQEKAHKVGVFRSSGSISICELLAV